MALEPEDRTEEIVGQSKPKFEAKQSNAQLPKKTPGTCRMVVEFPFEFSRDFLIREGKKHQGRAFLDGVEYLRVLQARSEAGDLNEADLKRLFLKHNSGNGIRWTAAK